ncbi:hypothetical protein OK006_7630 [Actinobacteria bacterium OK006]|nr:hypothetical protein OK006_7630 [Actinobacteria bacterium OK006]
MLYLRYKPLIHSLTLRPPPRPQDPNASSYNRQSDPAKTAKLERTSDVGISQRCRKRPGSRKNPAEDVALGDLRPFPGNARRGDLAVILQSLVRTRQFRSLIVRDTGDSLVPGHRSLKPSRTLPR